MAVLDIVFPKRVLQLLLLAAVFLPLPMVLYSQLPPSMTTFVFGDSLVDTGNNNYITTLSRADYPPNGIDFLPDHLPTGRFTNGRTIPDILADELGLDVRNLPYLAPETTGDTLLRGVNYASGAGGILNDTGALFGGRINLDVQIDNFATTRQQLITMLGSDVAEDLLRNSLFTVTIGANDFINNYLIPIVSAPERAYVPPEMFVQTMITKFAHQLQRLYNLDARKVVVTNVGPIGCIPYTTDLNPTSLAGDGCVEFPNQLAVLYNQKLKGLLAQLGSTLPQSRFIYADVYRILSDILQNYHTYGFDVADSACCKLAGQHGGLLPCGPPSQVCTDRSKYVFWDAYHPSEAANWIITRRLINGGPDDISPINVLKLLRD